MSESPSSAARDTVRLTVAQATRQRPFLTPSDARTSEEENR